MLSIKKLFSKKDSAPAPKPVIAVQMGKLHSSAAIWRMEDNQITIDSISQSTTPEQAIRKIKTRKNSTQIVFGVPDEWTDTSSHLKQEYKQIIANLSKSFALVPIGYTPLSEAVATYLHNQKDVPPTAILVDVSDTSLGIALYRVGKKSGFCLINRTSNLYTDINKGLETLSVDSVLPSRIILYDETKSLETVKDQLLSYPWQDNERFIHVPKIEILSSDTIMEAIVFASSQHLDISDKSAIESKAIPVDNDEIVKEKSDDKISNDEVVANQTTASTEFGFHEIESETTPVEQKEKIAVDTKQIVDVPIAKESKTVSSRFAFFSTLSNKKRFIAVGLISVGILTVIIIAFYFYPQAQVNLLAQPKIEEQTVSVTVDPSSDSVNAENNTIPGRILSVTLSESDSKQTTGTKTTGDPAKGTVTVYNKTDKTKSFDKGTLLTTDSGLTFTLDSTITIASASDTGESLTYGKTNSSVTASKIGPKGNVEANTEFTVSSNPKGAYIAKNDEKFGGGTEREINVVSEEDQSTLYKSVSDSLKQKAISELKKQISSEETTLDESLLENIITKTFDAKVNDESDTVGLNLEAEYSVLVYKIAQLNELSAKLGQNLSDGAYTIDKEKSQLYVDSMEKQKDGTTKINARYKLVLIPIIDEKQVSKSIAGKPTNILTQTVESYKDRGIIGYELYYIRSLPFLKETFPFRAKAIIVKIQSQ